MVKMWRYRAQVTPDFQDMWTIGHEMRCDRLPHHSCRPGEMRYLNPVGIVLVHIQPPNPVASFDLQAYKA